MRSTLISLYVLCGLCGASTAAPTVTYFAPAGAKQGTTVEVTAGGTFAKWPVEVWVSGAGVTATAAKEKGKLAVTAAPDAAPGTYWFRLHDETGASQLRPFIVGSLPEVAEAEPNNSPQKPQTVAVPAVVNGRLAKSGDVDCYAVELRAGQTLVAAVEAHHTLRSPLDAVIQIVSADGFVLEQSNDHAGFDPLVPFTAPAGGTYLVRLFAFPATPDSSIRFYGAEAAVYRLTLTAAGYADHAWPPAVAKDGPGTVGLFGWNIPEAARAGLKPRPAGERTATVHHPAVAGAVTTAVLPHPCHLASEVRERPLPPPFTVSGRFGSPGERDRLRVTGKKGQPLTLKCESSSLGFAICPALTVRDAAGKELARVEPRRPDDDAELKFTPPTDETYTVEVRDLFDQAGPRHVYRLTVRPPQPDFTLSLASDQVRCEPGKPTDVEVTVNRQDGFKGEITLTAEGLPKGVTAAMTKPKGKADPAKLSLRITATGKYTPGPIRVVGTSTDRSQTRTATAPLAEFGTATADLWLSTNAAPPVVKKKRR